jgi:hypothetical protein
VNPTDVYAVIVARIRERLALVEAIMPGPWVRAGDYFMGNREVYALSRLIEANDPAFTRRMCLAALERMEHHRPRRTLDFHELAPCACSPRPGPTVLWSRCPVVRTEADVWQVEWTDESEPTVHRPSDL